MAMVNWKMEAKAGVMATACLILVGGKEFADHRHTQKQKDSIAVLIKNTFDQNALLVEQSYQSGANYDSLAHAKNVDMKKEFGVSFEIQGEMEKGYVASVIVPEEFVAKKMLDGEWVEICTRPFIELEKSPGKADISQDEQLHVAAMETARRQIITEREMQQALGEVSYNGYDAKQVAQLAQDDAKAYFTENFEKPVAQKYPGWTVTPSKQGLIAVSNDKQQQRFIPAN